MEYEKNSHNYVEWWQNAVLISFRTSVMAEEDTKLELHGLFAMFKSIKSYGLQFETMIMLWIINLVTFTWYRPDNPTFFNRVNQEYGNSRNIFDYRFRDSWWDTQMIDCWMLLWKIISSCMNKCTQAMAQSTQLSSVIGHQSLVSSEEAHQLLW